MSSTRQKKIPILPVILFPLMFTIGCDFTIISNSGSREEHREEFAFTKPTAARSELSISNINGNITVVGVDDLSAVEITGFKIAEDRSLEEAKERIKEIRIEILESPTRLTLKSSHPNSAGGRMYRVDYEIRIPSAWKVTVVNVNGNVSILNINNTTKATITNGTLEAWDIRGNVDGDVTNGTINARVYLPANGSCVLGTLNGTVAVLVPRSTSAAVTANTTNGTVSVSNLPLVLSSSSRTSISGTLGDGKGTIRLSTLNGTVQLTGF